MFTQNFWRGHSLGLPILGTPDTVPQFSRSSILDCFKSWYAPENTVITAAGNLEHSRLVELVTQEFGGMSRANAVAARMVPDTHSGIDQRDKKELEQVHLVLGVPSYHLAHERRYAASLLNIILGSGMSSRLFQNIRERQGLAYAIFSELSPYTDTGVLSVYAGTSRESVEQLIRSVVDEFRAIRKEAVSAEELRRAKDHLKGSMMLSLESTSSRMSNLARMAMYFNRFLSLDEMLDSIEKVTREQVLEIAQDFFHPGKITLTVLGNLRGLRMTPDLLTW